jgi:hypothetical protein
MQVILVILTIFLATAYFGILLYRKVNSFSTNNKCGGDCGCESKLK